MNNVACTPYIQQKSFGFELVANGVVIRDHQRGLTYVFGSLDEAFEFIRKNAQ